MTPLEKARMQEKESALLRELRDYLDHNLEYGEVRKQFTRNLYLVVTGGAVNYFVPEIKKLPLAKRKHFQQVWNHVVEDKVVKFCTSSDDSTLNRIQLNFLLGDLYTGMHDVVMSAVWTNRREELATLPDYMAKKAA